MFVLRNVRWEIIRINCHSIRGEKVISANNVDSKYRFHIVCGEFFF